MYIVQEQCVHKSQQNGGNSLNFAQIQKMLVPFVLSALLSVQLYKEESSFNVHDPSTVFARNHKCVYV